MDPLELLTASYSEDGVMNEQVLVHQANIENTLYNYSYSRKLLS